MAGTKLQDDENYRQNGGADDRFQVNGPRLRTNPLQLNGVGDRLSSRVHVAQTARGKAYSGLIARLIVAEPREPEQREAGGSRHRRRVQCEERGGEHGAGPERNDAEPEPLPLAAGSDVRNRANGYVPPMAGARACVSSPDAHQPSDPPTAPRKAPIIAAMKSMNAR